MVFLLIAALVEGSIVGGIRMMLVVVYFVVFRLFRAVCCGHPHSRGLCPQQYRSRTRTWYGRTYRYPGASTTSALSVPGGTSRSYYQDY